MFVEHGTPFYPLARFHSLRKNLGKPFGILGIPPHPPHSRTLRARRILDSTLNGSHYTTKSELISPKIQIKNSKNGLGRAKQYSLGYGFALPRLISARRRVWEECARDSGACKIQNSK